jgi:hypothetical protein
VFDDNVYMFPGSLLDRFIDALQHTGTGCRTNAYHSDRHEFRVCWEKWAREGEKFTFNYLEKGGEIVPMLEFYSIFHQHLPSGNHGGFPLDMLHMTEEAFSGWDPEAKMHWKRWHPPATAPAPNGPLATKPEH